VHRWVFARMLRGISGAAQREVLVPAQTRRPGRA